MPAEMQMKRNTRWEMDTFCPRGGANVEIPSERGGRLKVSILYNGHGDSAEPDREQKPYEKIMLLDFPPIMGTL